MRIEFGRPETPVHIQTHTSHVFLLGDDVYKVKKPVDFSFLDYSTLSKRRACCESEVALNRRFSPEVYVGVVPLYGAADGALALEGEGEPVEWAVRMRRLPEEAMMARRLAAGDVREEEVVALADLLGRFYRDEADRGAEIAMFGSPDQVRQNTVENFDTTLDFGEDLFPGLCRHLLRAANRRFLAERTALFLDRVASGRVVDGHGDLKPENIFLTGSGPVVTDCIEFNERFRFGDVLADLAYLTMALREAGREDLRAAFLGRYRERYEPGFPEDLLAYYETYRAVVKGKIEGYRARQPEVPAAEREEARGIARRHFHLARSIVLGGRPVLAVIAGDPALAAGLVSGLDAAEPAGPEGIRAALAAGRSVVYAGEPGPAFAAAGRAAAVTVHVGSEESGEADLTLTLAGSGATPESLAAAVGEALAAL